MAEPPAALAEAAAREDVDAVRRLLRGLDARAAFPFRRWLTLKLGRGAFESCGPLNYEYWSRHSARYPVDFYDVDFIDSGRALALVVNGAIHVWDALSGSRWSNAPQWSAFDAIATVPHGTLGVGVGKRDVLQIFHALSKAPYREVRRTSPDFGCSIALHPLGVLCAEGTGGSPGVPITRTDRVWVDDEYEPRVYPELPELTPPYWKETVTIIGYEAPPRDWSVCVWDLDARRMLRRLPHDGTVIAVAISTDGTSVAALSRLGSLRVYDLHSGVERFRASASSALQIGISPDGSWVLVPGADGIELFQEGVRASTLHTGEKMVAVALSLDATLAAAVSEQGTVYLFELPSQRRLGAVKVVRGAPLRVRISPDMCQVVVPTADALFGVELCWAPAERGRRPAPSVGLKQFTLDAMVQLTFAGHGETPLETLAAELRVPLQLEEWPSSEQSRLGLARPLDFCPELAGSRVTAYRDDWLRGGSVTAAQRWGSAYLNAGGDALTVTLSPTAEELGTVIPLLGSDSPTEIDAKVRVQRTAEGWRATALVSGKSFLDGHALEPEGRVLKNGSRLLIGERAYVAWMGEPHGRRKRLQALRLADPLTGLPLRPALLEHLAENAPGGLLCFAVDDPLQARLEYGDGADLWLASGVAIFVGQRVTKPALLARLDEAFALFLPNATEKSLQSAASSLCERIEAESFGLDGAFVQLRCGGVRVSAEDEPQDCIKQALEKMADALHYGNGSVVI
jgi:GGDEF domain-containing protein